MFSRTTVAVFLSIPGAATWETTERAPLPARFLGWCGNKDAPLCYSSSLLRALGCWCVTCNGCDLYCVLVMLLGRLAECWKEWFINRGIQKP